MTAGNGNRTDRGHFAAPPHLALRPALGAVLYRATLAGAAEADEQAAAATLWRGLVVRSDTSKTLAAT